MYPNLHGLYGHGLHRSNVYQGSGPSAVFHGGELPPRITTFPAVQIGQARRSWQLANKLPVGGELPWQHTLDLIRQGAEGLIGPHTIGALLPLLNRANSHPTRGGFLPFLLPALPAIGSALSGLFATAGPALAAGAAGALGKIAVDKITGNGVEAIHRAPIPLYYHKSGHWVVGHGISDIFKKIFGHAQKAITSDAAKRIGSAGRDAMVDATIDALTGARSTPTKKKVSPPKKDPRKHPTPRIHTPTKTTVPKKRPSPITPKPKHKNPYEVEVPLNTMSYNPDIGTGLH